MYRWDLKKKSVKSKSYFIEDFCLKTFLIIFPIEKKQMFKFPKMSVFPPNV